MSRLVAALSWAFAAHRRRVVIWAVIVLAIVLLLSLQALFPESHALPQWSGALRPGAVLAVFLAALACEYIDSSLGMGYGTTLTPLLLLAGFDPLAIVPCVLMSEFVTGLSAGWMHQRDGNVDFLNDRQARSAAFFLSALSILGALVAVGLTLAIPKFWLTAIIAVIIFSVGLITLATVRRRLEYRRTHMLALGAVAAFNKALSGGGYGPLVTAGQVVSGLSPKHAVAITSLAEAFTCAVGLVAYLVLQGGRIDWTLVLPLTAGAVLSVPVATLTVRCLPEVVLRGTVGAATCLLGLFTAVKLFW